VFERCYRQQPNVMFKHQLVMSTRGAEDNSQLVWSTSQQFNHMLQNQLRVPTLRSYEDDTNGDGVYDALHLEMELPLKDTEAVQSVSMMLLFDFRLGEMVDLHMDSAAWIEYTGASSGSGLSIHGDLMFRQRNPLPWFGTRDLYNEPIIDMNSPKASSYDLNDVFTNYLSRNETTDFVTRGAVWRGDRGAGQPFKVDINLRYPRQRICYRPGFWQEVKVGWMQYIAFFIPLWYISEWLTEIIFANQLVNTIVVQPRDKLHGT